MRLSRSVVSIILVVLTGLLVPLTLTATWLRNQVLDTDVYVATVKPLARDKIILDDIENQAVDAITNLIDTYVSQLPPEFQEFAEPIANETEDVIRDAIRKFLKSPTFRVLWEEANRSAHEQLDQLLTKPGSELNIQGDYVVLDLTEILKRVRDELVAEGVPYADQVPIEDLEFNYRLLPAKQLRTIRGWVGLLDKTASFMRIAILLCFAGALATSTARRPTLSYLGASFVAGGIAVRVFLGGVERIYLDRVPGEVSEPVARQVYAILLRNIYTWSLYAVWFGTVIVIAALIPTVRRQYQRWTHRAQLQ